MDKCFCVIFNELCEALDVDAIVVDDELAAIVAPRAAATAEGVDTLDHWALECEDSTAAIFSLVHTDKLSARACTEALEGATNNQLGKCRSLLRLFGELALCADTMDAGSLVRGGKREVKTEHVLEMCRALACVQQLTSALGAIHCCCQQGTALKQRRLDERIVALLADMASTQRPRWELLEELAGGSSHTPWVVPFAALRRWFHRLDAALPSIKRRLMRMLVQEASKEVNTSVDALPKYQHFLNDSVFNKKLCQRHLLVPEVKRKIQQALTNIHSMRSHIKEVYDKWQMLPGLNRDEDFALDISSMEEGCACAKTTAAVVAATSIILEMKGEEQVSTAQSFLETRRGTLPKALANALDCLGVVAAVPLAKRARRYGRPSAAVPLDDAADESIA